MPYGPRPGTTREHELEQYRGHALHDQSDAHDARFVACPGKAEGRPEIRRTGRPPPLPPRPGRSGCADPPQGRHATPSQAGGERDWAAPPQDKPNEARDRGRTRGGARTAWNGPTGTARGARATPTQGGGGDARARAHAHAKDTRGIPEGQPDRARGRHRPHGMAYQRARIRDNRTGRPATHSAGNTGREGGNGEDTKPGTVPNPPERAASAAHTRPGHCGRQGSIGAPGHAPTQRLGSLRASPRGSHWRQASSTAPAAPAPWATTH